MAQAAEGAKEVSGAEVERRRVPETLRGHGFLERFE